MAMNFTKMVNASTKNIAKPNESEYQILDLNPRDLIDDPDNKEVYSDYDVEMLALTMKQDGVFGTIIAYPYEGGYKIESGHRRKYAAIEAGLSKFPVMITTPPADDIDRRKRLIRANLHSRDYTVMTIAREADYLYKTYELERDKLALTGQKMPLSPAALVAQDLEISESQVSRYRKLLTLDAKLQSLVEKYEIPWIALCEASELTEKQQQNLYTRILNTIKSHGGDAITTSFIRDQIEECSLIKEEYHFNRESLTSLETPDSSKDKKSRRINGATTITKSVKNIMDSLDPDKSFIKNNKKEDTLKQLKELSSFLTDRIKELEVNGFSEDFNKKI